MIASSHRATPSGTTNNFKSYHRRSHTFEGVDRDKDFSSFPQLSFTSLHFLLCTCKKGEFALETQEINLPTAANFSVSSKYPPGFDLILCYSARHIVFG